MIIFVILFTVGVAYEMFSDAEPKQQKQQIERYEKEHRKNNEKR